MVVVLDELQCPSYIFLSILNFFILVILVIILSIIHHPTISILPTIQVQVIS